MAGLNKTGTSKYNRPAALRNIVIVVLCSFFLCKPTQTSISQATLPPPVTHPSKDTENIILKKVVDENQIEIANKLNELKNVVKPKVVYVRVYEAPPKKKSKGYIQVERSKLQLLGIDSDKLNLIVIDTISTTPPKVEPLVKKLNFFQRLAFRLFHHKKHKK
jgi:hypothetical protein